MDSLSYFWKKTKQTVQEHPIFSITTLGITGYFLFKFASHNTELVSLTDFLKLLNQNDVKECIIQEDNTCYFLAGGVWYAVNVGLLSKEKLYQLTLSGQDIQVTSIEAQETSQILTLVLSAGSLWMAYRMMASLDQSQGTQNRKRKEKRSTLR